MANLLKILQLALSLVPLVINLVKAIEMPGSGPDKAAAIVNIVRAALEIVPEELKGLIGLEKIEAFVQKVINIVVAFLNKTGVFEHSS